MRAAETRTETMEMLVPQGKEETAGGSGVHGGGRRRPTLTKIAEMVPGSTGDLEEQQEMLRKERSTGTPRV